MFDITWFLAVLSLSGNVFNVKKRVSCFYIWTLSEIFWFILDFLNKSYGRAFLDSVQLVMAIWGIFEWKKKELIKKWHR